MKYTTGSLEYPTALLPIARNVLMRCCSTKFGNPSPHLFLEPLQCCSTHSGEPLSATLRTGSVVRPQGEQLSTMYRKGQTSNPRGSHASGFRAWTGIHRPPRRSKLRGSRRPANLRCRSTTRGTTFRWNAVPPTPNTAEKLLDGTLPSAITWICGAVTIALAYSAIFVRVYPCNTKPLFSV